MSPWLKIIWFCASAFLFIGCDRITKDLAKEHLQHKASLSYLHNTVRLVYVENTGAAMSFADDLPRAASFWLLSILPLIFLILLSVYTVKYAGEMRFAKIFSFSLIISGGLGNVIDRIIYDRHVTDFMIVGIGKIQTGIFNFADVCVTAGAIGLMLYYQEKKTTGASVP